MCDKAKAELQRHLALPSARWNVERAASMRYIAKCSQGQEREEWFIKAHKEAPDSREPLVDLSEYYYENENWLECLRYALKALDIKDRPEQYLNEARAWGALPHDLAAISLYNLGRKEEALTYGQQALMLDPNDERLKKNVEFYSS
jgi:tetratricopeptide (TPR) repeat protein